MKLIDITEELKTFPGEYIYHEPSSQIVLCGSFSRANNQIRALANGSLFVDVIANFKKIRLTRHEEKLRHASKCKGCGA
mgnify:CR=1 FL=1|tara:strand:- start:216 stop:452 length:237 start_codon:yes stop_codon:yes gene_type:complete